MIIIISKESKLKRLRDLSEDSLRKQVLIPLLSNMGFSDVIENHHNNEKGKDIICKELDEKFGDYKYLSVIVKKGDVNGSASDKKGIFNIINQIRQSINEPYSHVYETKRVKISEYIVVASGTIKPTALDAIMGAIENEHIDIAMRHMLDGEKLIRLIDKFFNEYWINEEQKYEAILKERNCLLENSKKLLELKCHNNSDLLNIIRKDLLRDFDIQINDFSSNLGYLADVGIVNINIEAIDEFYLDDIPNNVTDDLPSEFIKLKRAVYDLLFEMDEAIENLKNILKQTDPIKIVDFVENIRFSHVVGNKLQFSLDKVYDYYDYIDEFKFYRIRKEKLIENNTIRFLNLIKKDIKSKLFKKIQGYFTKKNNQVHAVGYKIKFSKNYLDKKLNFHSDIYDINSRIDKSKYNGDCKINYSYIDAKNYICVEANLDNCEKNLIDAQFIEVISRDFYETVIKILSNVFFDELSYEIDMN